MKQKMSSKKSVAFQNSIELIEHHKKHENSPL